MQLLFEGSEEKLLWTVLRWTSAVQVPLWVNLQKCNSVLGNITIMKKTVLNMHWLSVTIVFKFTTM